MIRIDFKFIDGDAQTPPRLTTDAELHKSAQQLEYDIARIEQEQKQQLEDSQNAVNDA